MLFPIYRKAYTAIIVFLPSDKGSAIWQTSCCNGFITLKYKKKSTGTTDNTRVSQSLQRTNHINRKKSIYVPVKMSKISINHTRPVLFYWAFFIISVFACLYKFSLWLNTFMYRCVEKDWKQVWYAVLQ